MSIRIAINGYGRIGRNIVRALYESGYRDQIILVAINDLGDVDSLAYLTQYDSTAGKFVGTVTTTADKALVINGDTIATFAERDPSQLPWQKLNVDVVLECTGLFTSREKASRHLQAGAKKVLISAPAGSDIDATIVYGVNEDSLTDQHKIVSNASCTTNCLAPVVKPLHDAFGIVSGLMVTVHAYTNDQLIVDGYHSDRRRGRAAACSMIPTKTGAAAAVGLVLPELNGKLDGYAVRVPTPNVSMIDLTFSTQKATSVAEINQTMKAAASHSRLKSVLTYNEEQLVSIDFNHNPASSIFDATQTRQVGSLYKVVAWYDNEWGFSNRMLDTCIAMARVKKAATVA